MQEGPMKRDGTVAQAKTGPDEPSERVGEIRARAYELFLTRSEHGGDASEFLDWAPAEAEMLARRRARQP